MFASDLQIARSADPMFRTGAIFAPPPIAVTGETPLERMEDSARRAKGQVVPCSPRTCRSASAWSGATRLTRRSLPSRLTRCGWQIGWVVPRAIQPWVVARAQQGPADIFLLGDDGAGGVLSDAKLEEGFVPRAAARPQGEDASPAPDGVCGLH